MAIEVFNRYEKKYMLNEEQYEKLIEQIKPYMLPDKFNEDKSCYKICNIYYDTENDSLIRASIEKPVYKEKLRLRCYDCATENDNAFVEIKKKYNGIVNKRRTHMRLKDAYRYLSGDIDSEELFDIYNGINRQVLEEIDYFKGIYSVIPKLYLSYDRRAYFGIMDKEFRVTFDKNITTRRNDLKLELGSYGEQLLPEGMYLMEVKTCGATPLWFVKILSEMQIYPRSFSKYGTEYRNYVLCNYAIAQK